MTRSTGIGRGRVHPPGLRLQAALLAARTTDNEAARRYDVSRRTILRWRQQLGIPSGYRPQPPAPERTCNIDGCHKNIRDGGRGWCTTHYARWRKHGDPHKVTRPHRYPDELRQQAIQIATTEGLDTATVTTGVTRETIKTWCRQEGHDVARPYRRTPAPTLTIVPDNPPDTTTTRIPTAADMLIPAVVLAAHRPASGWRQHAACRGTDPAVWHPERGDTQATHRAICWSCPVRLDCAATHLNEHQGIWGGLSERQRRRLRPEAAAAGWTPPTRRPTQLPETGT